LQITNCAKIGDNLMTDEYKLGLLVLLTLPVIFLHFKQTQFRHLILSFILISSFIGGSLELLGIISEGNLGVIREIFILLLFFSAFFHIKRNSIRYINILPVILLALIVILSAIVNSTSFLKCILFSRFLFLPMLFFLILYNYPLSKRYYIIFRNLIIGLFLTQIFANIGKYFIIGMRELFIGTMLIGGGSLTVIIALIGISFSFAYYLKFKKLYYILIIIGFYIFSIIGRKRGVVVYIPLTLIMTYYLYVKYYMRKVISFKVDKILLVFILSIAVIYVGVRINPDFNSEHIVWGNFDINYALDFVWNYNVYKTSSYADYYGRFDGYRAIKEVVLDKYGFEKLLFGLGPGEIIGSRFLDTVSSKGEYIAGIKFNIGYGSRMGFTWLLIQIGLLGAICFFFYYFIFFILTLKLSKNVEISDNDKVLLIGFLGVFFIYFLDFFTYSNTTIKSEPVVIPFMFFLSYFLKINTKKQ
jgi:hypothetical protein